MATLQVLTLAESQRWEEAVRGVPGWDIYWLPGYARIWQQNGDGEPHLALMQEEGETCIHLFMRRPIPGTDLADIASPYGYGGPLFTEGAADMADRFWDEFDDYCRQSLIVSEFVRFHPLLGNHRAPGPLQPALRGQTVYLDLTAAPWDGLKREVRNRIRKAEASGLQTRLTEAPSDLTGFLSLYEETMRRRSARDYYFFNRASFETMRNELGPHLLMAEVYSGESLCSAALFLYNDRYLHYHLGGSSLDWLPLAPNNKLFHDVAVWGRDRALRWMHLGGGLRPGDDLLRFKRGFSPLLAEFWTGQRVLLPEAYAELVRRHERNLNGLLAPGFFPAYRAPALI